MNKKRGKSVFILLLLVGKQHAAKTKKHLKKVLQIV
jgi:hypothetical protein